MRNTELLAGAVAAAHDAPTNEFFHHTSAKRAHTETVMAEAMRAQYPNLHLAVVPQRGLASFDPLAYASAGFATATPINDETENVPTSLKQRLYYPPATRLDGEGGVLVDNVIFGKFLYKWNGFEYFIYVVPCAEIPFRLYTVYFVLSSKAEHSDSLIKSVAEWGIKLHEQIWVYDQGRWSKSSELYHSMMKASWDDVILDADMKKSIKSDVLRFFDSRDRYEKLKVPWKRGIIYYGPPGNGKTISIKAMMNTLYKRKQAVPALYVRTLTSFFGPEYSVQEIFSKARQTAPCLLIFEDLDSIVSDQVRSYFLNEVDGIRANDGVLMIGSTNHLELLDPGISKRPSRFDRKYLFPKPNLAERTQYCEYWRGKLADNKDLEFPQALSPEIAKITADFSFAYMQEAFVATLLALAEREDAMSNDDEKNNSNNHEDKTASAPLDEPPTTNPQIRLPIRPRPVCQSFFDTTTWRTVEIDVNSPEYVNASKNLSPLYRGAGKLPSLEKGRDWFNDLPLWVEIQKQVKILREQI